MTSASPPQSHLRAFAALCAVALGLTAGFSSAPARADAPPEVQQLIRKGQYPQALEKVDAYLLEAPNDAQARFARGVILTETGKSAEAIEVFTRLTEEFPEFPESYNNLAVLYARQGLYERARMALEMAIRTHPSYAAAYENLGDLYARLAAQAYDKAAQLDARNKTARSKLAVVRELANPPAKPAPAPGAAGDTAKDNSKQ